MTVMLIEHVMELVMNISDRVIVLDYGRKIADGDPQAVADDPQVIKVYDATCASMARASEAKGGL